MAILNNSIVSTDWSEYMPHGNKGRKMQQPWPKIPFQYAKRPNRVRDVRLLRSITRRDLAKKVGISMSWMSFIEQGSMPLEATGEKIAKELGVTVKFLWPYFKLRDKPQGNELLEKDVYPDGIPGLTLDDVAQLIGVPRDSLPLDILPKGIYIVGVTDKGGQGQSEKEELMVARLPQHRLPPNQVIRKRRIELGLSQESLARKVGCSLNHISGIERGHVVPSVTIALQIANALGLEVDQVFKPKKAYVKRNRALSAVPEKVEGEEVDMPTPKRATVESENNPFNVKAKEG